MRSYDSPRDYRKALGSWGARASAPVVESDGYGLSPVTLSARLMLDLATSRRSKGRHDDESTAQSVCDLPREAAA